MIRFLSLFIAILSVPLMAQDIAINGPSSVKKDKQAVFVITGIKELAGSTIEYEPTHIIEGGVERELVVEIQPVPGYPVFFFSAETPLVYKLTFSSNQWVSGFYVNYAGAVAAGADPAILTTIKSALDQASRLYPSMQTSRTIEVTGPRPPPEPPGPPKPPTPDPTITGPVVTIVIRVAEDITADQNEALSFLRDYTDSEPKVRHYMYAPDQKMPDGTPDKKVEAWFKSIPGGLASLPYVFIVQAKVGGGSHIHWQGKLSTADEIINKIKERLK